MFCRELNLEHT